MFQKIPGNLDKKTGKTCLEFGSYILFLRPWGGFKVGRPYQGVFKSKEIYKKQLYGLKRGGGSGGFSDFYIFKS